MSEQDRPSENETDERVPPERGEGVDDPRKTAGGVDPVTGDQGEPESSNADIPAAG